MEKKFIGEHSNYIIQKTDFDFLGEKFTGKVRDVYIQSDKLILITTDRFSSFDRNVALIPFKGQVLNQMSFYNFKQAEDIVKNHIIDVPDPNVIIAKKCNVAPIEVVVRGFLTGSTQTSILTRYNDGQRDFSDFVLPDGMKKNQRFDNPLITPTTKFEEHDRNLTETEVVEGGFLTKKQWDEIREVALRLFARGQEIAQKHDLILVDTKYEFGYDKKGDLILIDEIHTPDSSRYWFAASYEERFIALENPEFFDKEFLRLWFKERCDPYKDKILPKAPQDIIVEMSYRYVSLFEQLTGDKFEVDVSINPLERIKNNLQSYIL